MKAKKSAETAKAWFAKKKKVIKWITEPQTDGRKRHHIFVPDVYENSRNSNRWRAVHYHVIKNAGRGYERPRIF